MDFNTLKLIALAIAPAVALGVFIYWRDKWDKEPIRILAICFALGILSCVIAAGIELGIGAIWQANTKNVFETAIEAFVVVGFTEEFCKYIWLRGYAYPKKEFNEPYDGITYSVMVSLGFATFENIFYVLEGGSGTALMRMFTAMPAHTTFAVIMGFFVGMAKFTHNSKLYNLIGLLMAVLFHGAYDFFLFLDSEPWIVLGAVASLIVGIWLSLKAIKIHRSISPFNRDNYV
jgi:RsiW-degrading membrane proteinase PrsW (M82 family)